MGGTPSACGDERNLVVSGTNMVKDVPLPESIEKITKEYLESTIEFGRIRSMKVEYFDIQGVFGTTARFNLEFVDNNKNSPTSVVVKMSSPTIPRHVGVLLYLNEYTAYDLLPRMTPLFPRCYYSKIDRESLQFIIIMEDVTARGTCKEKIDLEKAKKAMEFLAWFHVQFWGQEKKGDWGTSMDDFVQYGGLFCGHKERMNMLFGEENLKNTLGMLQEKLSKLQYKKSEMKFLDKIKWLELFEKASRKFCSKDLKVPQCLVHGDYRPVNIAYQDDGSIKVLDWQFIRVGCPVQDVAWFLCSAIIGDLMPADYSMDLARFYHSCLGERITEDYPLEVYMDDLKDALIMFQGLPFINYSKAEEQVGDFMEYDSKVNSLFSKWHRLGMANLIDVFFKEPELPDGIEKVSKEYLERTLGFGIKSMKVEYFDIQGVFGTTARFNLEPEENDKNYPTSVVVKMSSPTIPRHVGVLLYLNEFTAYDVLPQKTPLFPKCYYSKIDQETMHFIIIMEDVTAKGTCKEKIDLEKAKKAIDFLAKFHVQFWGQEKKGDWDESVDDFVQYGGLFCGHKERIDMLFGEENLKNTLGMLKEKLSKLQYKKSEMKFLGRIKWLELFEKASRKFCAKDLKVPQCLVHGDYRPVNIAYQDDGSIKVIDWQFLRVGCPVQDVAWFLCSAVVGDLMPADYSMDLVRFYHSQLGEEITKNYPFEVYMDDLKDALIMFQGLPFINYSKAEEQVGDFMEYDSKVNSLFSKWHRLGMANLIDVFFKEPELPDGIEKVSKEYLERTLGFGIKNMKVEFFDIQGVFGTTARFVLEPEENDKNYPTSVVVKMSSPTIPRHVGVLLYLNEFTAYDVLPEMTPLFPKCYYSKIDQETMQFIIIMEDVTSRGTCKEKIDLEKAKKAIFNLAKFHVQFWGQEKKGDWDESVDDFVQYGGLFCGHKERIDMLFGEENMNKTLGMLKEKLSSLQYKKSEMAFLEEIKWLELFEKASRKFCSKDLKVPQCLVHGDYRPVNIAYQDDGSIKVIDWQFLRVGCPVQDVAWFLCSAVVGDLMPRDYSVQLAKFYHKCLGEEITKNYPMEVYMDDLKDALIMFQGLPFINYSKAEEQVGDFMEYDSKVNSLFSKWHRLGMDNLLVYFNDPELPEKIEKVSKEYLESTLGFGIKNMKVEYFDIQGVFGTTARFNLEPEENDKNHPTSVVVKMSSPTIPRHVGVLLYLNEFTAYDVLPQKTPLFPKCYYSKIDQETMHFIIIMEDVTAKGTCKEKIDLEKAKKAIDFLAKFHVQFWGQEKKGDWDESVDDFVQYGGLFCGHKERIDMLFGEENLKKTLGMLKEKLSKLQYKKSEMAFLEEIKWLELFEKASKKFCGDDLKVPQCLVHGDYRPVNIAYQDDGSIKVIDWQFLRVGCPVQDVAWFLCSAVVGDLMPADYSMDLAKLYHSGLGEEITKNYPFEVYLDDLKDALIMFQGLPFINYSKAEEQVGDFMEYDSKVNSLFSKWHRLGMANLIDVFFKKD